MKRIVYLDYLKVLGLLLVMLAHVSPPLIINQLRSFDVPLLVIISAYLAKKTYKEESLKEYLWKRIKRLVFPAWCFCFIFIIIRTLFYNCPSLVELIKEFTFQRDSDMLGFLWVIWVYIICAALIPLIKKIRFSFSSILLIIAIFLCFEILSKTNLTENRILYLSFFTIIPYGSIAFLGYNIDNIKKPTLCVIGFLAIYVVSAIIRLINYGDYLQTDYYKYPAQLYYVSYATGISLLLFFAFKDKNLPVNKPLIFISSNSLWIYFWHILALYAVKMFIVDDSLWFIQYCAIVLIAIIITYIQNIIVDNLMKRYNIKWLIIFKG